MVAWSPPGVDIKIYFRGGLQNIYSYTHVHIPTFFMCECSTHPGQQVTPLTALVQSLS